MNAIETNVDKTLDIDTIAKRTVGAEAYDRLINPDTKQGIIDTQREIDKTYMDDLRTCATNARDMLGLKKPFFVVVTQKKERLMENVIRRYFYARQTLPHPDYDQTVWVYDKSGEIRLMWVIPDHNTVQEMTFRPWQFGDDMKELLWFVKKLNNYTLYPDAIKEFMIPKTSL